MATVAPFAARAARVHVTGDENIPPAHDSRYINFMQSASIDPPFNFHVNFAAIACPCRFLLFARRLFRLEIAMMYRTRWTGASTYAIVRQPSQCSP